MSSQIDALRDVLAGDPDNHDIRRLLADLLSGADRAPEAVAEYLHLHRAGVLDADGQAAAAQLALQASEVDAARELLGTAPSAPATAEPTEPGTIDFFESQFDAEPSADQRERSLDGPPEVRGGDFIDSAADTVTFADVGGLSPVKKVIDRLIVQPLQRPDLFAKYGKRAGGGILLFGPPGCGKTLIARATAGQVGLPFYNLRIEDIVDPYYGVSEQRLAGAFEAARELRPCILFIDELDALGYARSQQNSERARSLVEVLLTQLDSIGSDNENLLVLAASNEPWDIDGALLRPGRFDRTIFVPPPDAEARESILTRELARTPKSDIKVRSIVKQTPLFSGADIRELANRALEEVLEEAMATNTEPPLRQEHIDTALADLRPSTVPWLTRARNHAEFGNVGGRWDELEKYLKSRDVARQLRQRDTR